MPGGQPTGASKKVMRFVQELLRRLRILVSDLKMADVGRAAAYMLISEESSATGMSTNVENN
ncbi:hypothetical protein Tcan_14921 [Toxocara canis]|uniref:Uncharacterized protein n=1 Tax=Toxocara canis TaxID=6265 RepID=A0A0B2V5A9_TOXCA|nr:hypothetical protein Tcan_14921 [Toxocara canis]